MKAPALGSSALTMPVAGQPSGLATCGAEPLEQPQLRVAVRLPGAVQLEVLVGQVGQDRHVVGDGVDPPERQPVRGRLDDRGRVAGDGPSPGSPAGARGASGVVAWASFAAWTPPILVSAVPVIPVRMPAASSAATARNEVVVLPSVPVIPTTARSRLGSPYHQAAAAARAVRLSATTSCGRSTSGSGVLDDRGRGAGRGCRRDELVAVDVEARDGHEQRAGPDLARVVGHAAHGDRGQAGRPDRAPVAAGAGQPVLGGEPLDEPLERRRGRGLGGVEQLGERSARSSSQHLARAGWRGGPCA